MKVQWAVPVIFTILITSGFGISQQAFAQIPPGFVDFNGHCYGLTSPNTWENTELLAVNFGGHLVTIDDVAENTFVQTISSPDNSWIGYNDVDVEGTFVWVSGLVTGYENWRPGEPNGLPGEDAVAFITVDADWVDFPNFNILTGIVELPFTCESASTTEVEIDIKPGSDPSSVNCKNLKGNVPVAIFGAENFDATTIDIEIVSMSLVSSSPIPVTEVHDKLHIDDLNDDGFDDVVLHLDKAGVCEATTTAPLKETVEVELTGETTDGTQFIGIGDIRIVKR